MTPKAPCYPEAVRRGRTRIAFALLSATWLLPACGPSNFTCAEDTECGGDGACIEGFCAFPDEACTSGFKYGQHSGDQSNQCVPPSGGTESGSDSVGDAGSNSGSDGSGPSGGSFTTGSETSGETTDADPTTTETASATNSTTSEPAGPVEFIDDELVGEFGAGELGRLEYTEGRLRLAELEVTGTFTSRVFDAGAPVQWQTLSWQPDGPYGKALPNEGQAEAGYVDGVDMAENILLMHFDESGDLPPGTMIADRSGRGNDGWIFGGGGTSSQAVAGLFGQAIDDSVDTYVTIPPGLPDFDFGTGGFTWALWFRYNHACPTNNVFMGIDDVVGGGDTEPHLWLGCTTSDWDECPGTVNEPRSAGVLRAVHDNSMDGVFYCGPGGYNDNDWHHMAIVKTGHAPTTVDLYVDGQVVQSVSGTFTAPIDMDAEEGDFGIGGFSGATYPSFGVFDDAAIWRRALSEDEVRAVYRRGALRVQVEVRVCDMEACADEPAFVGGAGLQPGSSFTDPSEALSPGTELSIDGLPAARYAQYRLSFTTDAPDFASPTLAAVALRGEYAAP